jgi:hypothetical protein
MQKLMSSELLKPWSEEPSEIERFVKERDEMLEKLDESGSNTSVDHENYSLSNERTVLAHRIVIIAQWARNEFQLIRDQCENYAKKFDDSSLGTEEALAKYLHDVCAKPEYFQTFWTLATIGRGDFDTNDDRKPLSKASIEINSIIDMESTSVINRVMFKDAIESIEGSFIEKISSLNRGTHIFANRLEGTSATFFNWNYLKSTLLKFHDMKLEYENQDRYLSGERLSSVRFPIMGCMDHIQGTVDDYLLLPCYAHNPPEVSPSNRAAYCAVRSSFSRLVEGKTYAKLAWDGPQSLAVMFFNKAPSGEIAQRMLEMQRFTVKGNDEHLKSCIHPTLYAYNVLWLSIELPMWCTGGTKDFYRKMQFSPDFIKRMFSTPDMHEFQAQAIQSERLTGFADLPENDVILVRDHLRTWQDRRSMLQLLFKASVRSVLAMWDETRPSHDEFVEWAKSYKLNSDLKIRSDESEEIKRVIVEIAEKCSDFYTSINKWKKDLANNCLITERTELIFGHDDNEGNSPYYRAVQYWHSLKKWDGEILVNEDREFDDETPDKEDGVPDPNPLEPVE